MKFILDFSAYSLLENFDLNKLYNQQKIVPLIRKEAKHLIDTVWNDAGGGMPDDMVRDRDKVELWLAKQIKNYIIKLGTEIMNRLYNAGDEKSDEYKNMKAVIDFFKCKDVDKDILEIPEVKSSLNIVDAYKRIHSDELSGIFDYFRSPMRNQHEPINLISSTLEDMDTIQRQWHESIKSSGKIYHQTGVIIKTYSDGFYWIDLQTNSSKEEGNAMGHCGTTRADTLLSLRKKSDGGHIEPRVTVAINYSWEYKSKGKQGEPVYYCVRQMKGKGNTKPVVEYHPYIVDLIIDEKLGINSLDMNEYSYNDDFHIYDLKDNNLIDKVLDAKPNMFDDTPLKFFEDRLVEIIKRFPHLKETEIFSDVKILYKHKCITYEEYQERTKKCFSDAHLEGDSLYVIIDSYKELSFAIKDEHERDFFEKLIRGEDSLELFYSDYIPPFRELDLDLLTEETINEILDKIDLDVLDENDLEILQLELGLDEVNTDTIREAVLNNVNSLVDILELDPFEEIKDGIIEGYRDAQELADESDAYKACKEAVEDVFSIIKVGDKYAVLIEDEWLELGEENEIETSDLMDYIFEAMGEVIEYASIDEPYYGWHGEIVVSDLNEMVKDKLIEI
jgi:hypothetical protein